MNNCEIKDQLEVLRRQLSQLSDSVEVGSNIDTVIEDIGACVIALNTLALKYNSNVVLAVKAEKFRLECLQRKELDKAINTLGAFRAL